MTSELQTILASEPAYRRKQIERAWFDVSINGYAEISTLPVALREKLSAQGGSPEGGKDFPWLSVEQKTMLQSKEDNTRKILFELADGNCVEMVIMGRISLKQSNETTPPRLPFIRGGQYPPLPERGLGGSGSSTDRYTVCVSSQAGCPMGCAFCATGQGGFKRNLTAEEIIDQVRFCQRLLDKEGARLSNIVVMGQGEPLLNYDNLKRALQIILANTDIGPTKITVSTAGIPKVMDQLLEDKDFPPVRWAISLHSAINETREKIMPFHQKDFFEFLIKWAEKYHALTPSRTHFIGLEYIMLGGFNDDEKHLKALIKLAKKIPRVRINLIPYNSDTTGHPPFLGEGRRAGYMAGSSLNTPTFVLPLKGGGSQILTRTPTQTIKHWHNSLMKSGFTSTIRYSQGQDIAAACGQLRNTIK